MGRYEKSISEGKGFREHLLMIFVTVGTHEQQFNRLLEYMDNYQKENPSETVFMQTGYSTFECEYAETSDFLDQESMIRNFQAADVVITHGGPSSFLSVVQMGKRVIVVPRQERFEEHVNNHQVDFLRRMVPLYQDAIIPVFDIAQLSDAISKVKAEENKKLDVENISHNKAFNKSFGKIISRIMGD